MSEFSVRFKKTWQLFLLTMIFYSLLRCCFFLWNFKQFLSNSVWEVVVSMIYGVRFDWTAVSALFIPLWILQWFPSPKSWDRFRSSYLLGSYLVIHVPFILMNFIDIDYINFSGRRFTKFGLNMVGEARGKMSGFFLTHGLAMIITAFFLFVLVKIATTICFRPTPPFNANHLPTFWGRIQKLARAISLGFFALVFLVIGARGGLQGKPIDFVSASFLPSSRLHNLTLNSSFTFLKSLDRNNLPLPSAMVSPEQMQKAFVDVQNQPSLLEGIRLKKPQNIVLLVVESLSYEYMGVANPKNSMTPFLDELANKSLAFSNAVANARRSIDGLPAILESIPSMMDESFITSEYVTLPLPSLANTLKKHGYHTSFFHGGNNGTLYLDSYTKGSGFDLFFGANEYNKAKDHDGFWGIYDEPFLQFFARKLSEFQEPFFSGVFTLSSHHPYVVPEKYKNKFVKGPLEISESMRYTDFSLREFFKNIENKPWYKDTLFIITADHTHKNLLPEYDNERGRYHIPLFLFHPQMQWPSVDRSQVVQQIDIMPTVLDFLGVAEEKSHHLSASIFKRFDRAAYFYTDNRYFMITQDMTVALDGDAQTQFYAPTDLNFSQSIDVDAAKKEFLGLRLKSAVQSYVDYLNAR